MKRAVFICIISIFMVVISSCGKENAVTENGVTEDMIEGIADGTIILEGGYKVLTRDEVVEILRESM